MGEKGKTERTETDNLISNLRGEVGESITTWLLMRHFMALATTVRSGDPHVDMKNRELRLLELLADKLRDDLVARLSELGTRKVGQLTFHFAARKLGMFDDDVEAFADFVVRHRLREKRNRDISHKQLPEKWSDHRYLHIQYPVLVRALAMGVRLMKRIDRHVLGPAAIPLWREARKRRYDFMSPPRVGYMLIPHIRLSAEQRLEVLRKEMEEGKEVWSRMPTTINGQPSTVLANKQWGILLCGDRAMALDNYPLQELHNIKIGPAEPEADPVTDRYS